ncbi:amino acid biosynthesis protein [Fructobacillus pseudoficulneus]|uniref:Amino acid biosynthesis protein n=1 Tax=Fructobacillus pseudoficulneus TaxID=220714 RepID=A0A3F3GSA8_9LACO|nr:hypothetical protein [Fructobacillus pseudoficulneus]GAP02511.1 amino acid biosynthesis protein [Fructobacillus pseudoficulneus]SEH37334.1 hypothetical protein SAMN05660469_0463 [Fructobacillus pseudoficulneus]
MAVIHTLGPKATDSYRAAKQMQDEDPAYQGQAIILHDNFEEVYQHLADFRGDFFLVPTAYQTGDGASWTRNNYRYLDQLTIAKVFHAKTLPMLLTENTSLADHTAITHAATIELLHQFMNHSNQELTIDYAPSKPLVQAAFESGQYQYAIFSKQDFQPTDTLKIIREYHPEMVWCLYQIK